MFNYYVYWGVFTNIGIFVSLALFLQQPKPSILVIILVYGGVIVLYFIFAGLRFGTAARVHKYYTDKYERKNRKAVVGSNESD